MPTETSENCLVGSPLQTPPKQTEPLPCPRCNSINTKFCYYNNYSLVQPRYFCKGCRRYWTQGGTLRNIPVGGGTRKTTKRSRPSNSANTSNSPSSSSTTTTTTTTTTCNSNISTSTLDTETLPAPVTATPSQVSPVVKVENVDHRGLVSSEKNEGYYAMWNAQGHGLVDPYVYGSGFGYGFCEMGIGFGGRGVWSYPGLSYIGGSVVNGEGVGVSGNTWQFSDVGSVGEGFSVHGENEGFAWPGLAISAPGKFFK